MGSEMCIRDSFLDKRKELYPEPLSMNLYQSGSDQQGFLKKLFHHNSLSYFLQKPPEICIIKELKVIVEVSFFSFPKYNQKGL